VFACSLALAVTVASALALAGCRGPAQPSVGHVIGTVEVPHGGLALCANCLRPDPARVVFNRTANGRQELLTQTGSSGRFHGTLPPGVYMVRAFTNHMGGGLCRPARLIRITAGQAIRLRLICINEIG
jgi:hypothetical protein